MNAIMLLVLAGFVYFTIVKRQRARKNESAPASELPVAERKSLRWTIRVIAWTLWIPTCFLAFGASIVMIESAIGYQASPYGAPTGFVFQAVWILVFFAGFPIISRLTQRIGEPRSAASNDDMNE